MLIPSLSSCPVRPFKIALLDVVAKQQAEDRARAEENAKLQVEENREWQRWGDSTGIRERKGTTKRTSPLLPLASTLWICWWRGWGEALLVEVEPGRELERGAGWSARSSLLLPLRRARFSSSQSFLLEADHLLPTHPISSLFISSSSAANHPFLSSRDDPLALQPRLSTSLFSSLLVRSTRFGRFFSRRRTRVGEDDWWKKLSVRKVGFLHLAVQFNELRAF